MSILHSTQSVPCTLCPYYYYGTYHVRMGSMHGMRVWVGTTTMGTMHHSSIYEYYIPSTTYLLIGRSMHYTPYSYHREERPYCVLRPYGPTSPVR
jgi:hypothetical protein